MSAAPNRTTSISSPVEAREPRAAPAPGIGLALGGGGARGIAHIHVLHAFDDLGVKPAAIAGSSIGALLGAGFAAGLSAAAIEEYALENLGDTRQIIGHLWRTRAGSLTEFLSDGGLRFGQFKAERVIAEFLPIGMPLRFEELSIPLSVTATQFYRACGCVLEEGELVSALAASIALPAAFRPVVREDTILVDGGICNPLPYDILAARGHATVAVDVTGPPQPPENAPLLVPSSIDAMLGASQLMMHAIIEAKCLHSPPDIMIRPPVSEYRVLDFLRVAEILTHTAHVREDAKREIAGLIERREQSGA